MGKSEKSFRIAAKINTMSKQGIQDEQLFSDLRKELIKPKDTVNKMEDSKMKSKLVKRYFACVTLQGFETDKEGLKSGWGTFLESHPYEIPIFAEQYIQKHAVHENFEYGTIQEKYITVERERQLLSIEEDHAQDREIRGK